MAQAISQVFGAYYDVLSALIGLGIIVGLIVLLISFITRNK